MEVVEMPARLPCDNESALTSAADAARVLVGLLSACPRAGAATSAGAPAKRRGPAGACKPRRIVVAATAAFARGGAEAQAEAPGTPTTRAAAPPRRRVIYYRPESRIDIAARTIMALLVARGASRWMREGALRAALGNTPDTSKGLRKLRTSGLVVRRGHGGRLDPYRYMVKAASNALSPEEQARAPPPPPEDDGDAMNGDSGLSSGVSKEAEQAAVVAGLDMAPCGAGVLPEESADSSCEAALASPATPMLTAWPTAALA